VRTGYIPGALETYDRTTSAIPEHARHKPAYLLLQSTEHSDAGRLCSTHAAAFSSTVILTLRNAYVMATIADRNRMKNLSQVYLFFAA
jgi:hypothetical protein